MLINIALYAFLLSLSMTLFLVAWPGQALSDCDQIVSEEHKGNDGASKEIFKLGKSLPAAFRTSMADDLHTPTAVAALSEPLKVMNDLMHTRKVVLFHSHQS